MDRVDLILQNRIYLEHMYKNNTAEAERRFCRHNMEHFFDVARIAYIISLEEKLEVSKEIIYATALLHDIGRHEQYEKGISHEVASAQIAKDILVECGFSAEETEKIAAAIEDHRTKEIMGQPTLSGIIYRADKASRACFFCAVKEECNWSDEKKNLKIKY